jgi:RecQ-mediated genome instability protein 1
VQDAAGTKAVAFELESVPRLFIGGSGSGNGIEANGNAVEGMSIGCKMVLQPGTLTRRGMIMLTPANVRVLGGKIEPWDRKWREDRKKRLIEEVVAETRPQEE